MSSLLQSFVGEKFNLLFSTACSILKKDEIEYFECDTADQKFIMILKANVTREKVTVNDICGLHRKLLCLKLQPFYKIVLLHCCRYLDGRWIFIYKLKSKERPQPVSNSKLNLKQVQAMATAVRVLVDNNVFCNNLSEYQWFLVEGEVVFCDLESLNDTPEIFHPVRTIVFDPVTQKKQKTKINYAFNTHDTVEEFKKFYSDLLYGQMLQLLTSTFSKHLNKHEACSKVCLVPFTNKKQSHKIICNNSLKDHRSKFKEIEHVLKNY